MFTKFVLTLVFTFKLLFCIAQTKKQSSSENWQNALYELNIFTKQYFGETWEVKNSEIWTIDEKNTIVAKITSLSKVFKDPRYKIVYLNCSNNDDCVYSIHKTYTKGNYKDYRKDSYSDLRFNCKSEEEMDKVFTLLSNFWFKLTGIESKTNYTNAELNKINEKLSNIEVVLEDVQKKSLNYDALKKHINETLFVEFLYINGDFETYNGSVKLNGKSYNVNSIKIKSYPEALLKVVEAETNTVTYNTVKFTETDTSTIEYKTAKVANELGKALKDYTTTVTNNQENYREEAVSEMKKLAEKVKEYNQSMKMYQKDCEKDKNFHKSVPYGRSTPCDNIVLYNKLIKSAIEEYLKKYESYITTGDVSYLKQQISQAVTNIENAKLK